MVEIKLGFPLNPQTVIHLLRVAAATKSSGGVKSFLVTIAGKIDRCRIRAIWLQLRLMNVKPLTFDGAGEVKTIKAAQQSHFQGLGYGNFCRKPAYLRCFGAISRRFSCSQTHFSTREPCPSARSWTMTSWIWPKIFWTGAWNLGRMVTSALVTSAQDLRGGSPRRESSQTPLKDLVLFAEAFWELPC